ncbi:phosphate ABC transporter permease subunit PstC [Microbacterium sediminis]|uniref:Phosphate transport system permease protein n=1 Tax=Microbacterium sediminis TaxID=904291 RepID=A0A1B9N874_9MICO|nr:phosphate ABC transporter permease subunit PstC [Microbacterium sediminis]OCG72734.1 phosphate ABC transporter permease subunit PstC [Microbacterium sediminis]QBR74752.1 phosphate ABC transporter permease subunit PstC [Microbacterium sediminis]
MTTTTTGRDSAPSSAPAKPVLRPGDRIFSGTALAAGIIILATLGLVALFLIVQSIPAFKSDTSHNNILDGQSFLTWVWPFVFGTLWASAIALVVAAPIAIGIALFISHYSPRRLAGVLGYIIDLLAAVPSVVFGLWGALTFAPMLVPFYHWLNEYLGWIPIFSGTPTGTGKTILTASLVLAVMILPIMTAICREVFLQTPKLHEEAALALGATRWEMVRMAVLPFARSGIVSGAMLGLGRALGETMAVTLVLSPLGVVTFNLLNPENPTTIPAIIALRFPEAHDEGVSTLVAAGLILFIVTFAVNFIARWIVNRRAEFSGAN